MQLLAKFKIPMPISVNAYYRSFRGRSILSKKGREYISEVLPLLAEQAARQKTALPVRCKVWADIVYFVKDKRKRDIDNPLKCLFDCLTKSGILEDDSQIKKLSAELCADSEISKNYTEVKIYDYKS